MIEDKRIEAFELRKNKDNNRKFNKQVKELRKQEGAQSRKEHISDVTKIRKDDTTDSAHKEERIKNIIDGQAVKSKKRINMVRIYFLTVAVLTVCARSLIYRRLTIFTIVTLLLSVVSSFLRIRSMVSEVLSARRPSWATRSP